MSTPLAMPIISRNCPAWTNDDFSGAYPASKACNAVYGGSDYWRCATTPTSNANSGVLTQAVYLAYDLSSVPVAQRQTVVLVWYSDPSTDPYDPTIEGTNYNNCPQAYTIDTNTGAGGGAPPSSGWTTRVTVSSETRHSRQHLITMAGANWIRINVTAINGSVSNNNVALNMDVHDVHQANADNWIWFGDSITQRGFDHDDGFISIGTLPAVINKSVPANFPLMENGGMGGFKAADIVAGNYLATWLPLFSGTYVGLNFGTNDANAGGAPVTNFQSNMQALVNQVVSAGKIPVIHKTIPWGSAAGIVANGPTINAALAALFAANPTIIQGPDLWAYFSANPSLISTDGIHPTDPALGQGNGYIAYRQQWATTLLATVYASVIPSIRRAKRRRGIFLPGAYD
jgi:lysophospholipase L1-like esterase